MKKPHYEAQYAYPTSIHACSMGRENSGAHYVARIDRDKRGLPKPPKIAGGPFDDRHQARAHADALNKQAAP